MTRIKRWSRVTRDPVKILCSDQCGAGEGSKVVRSHAEFDFRKGEKAIGEIAYENRVGNSIAFPDSSDDISTSLRIMPRGDKETQDLGGKSGNIRVFAILIAKISDFHWF